MTRVKMLLCILICANFLTETWSIPVNSSLNINNKKLSTNNGVNLSKPRSSFLPNLNRNDQLSYLEARSSKRSGKFFTSLPFLTGLGVGTLATSSAIASSGILQSPNSIVTTRLPRPIPASLIDSHTGLHSASIPQRGVLPISSNYLNIYDSHYPYVTFSTTLLDQSLRSIYHALENLRSQLARNDTLNYVTTTTEQLILPTTQDNVSTESIEEVTEGEETANIEIINARDTREVFNCSILKDVIRESIKQVNQDLEQRQAEQMEQTTSPPVIETTTEPVSPPTTQQILTEAPTLPPTTTTTTTTTIATTTLIPTPQINTTGSYTGYYGGSPQNINGIDLSYPVNPAIPASLYGQPNEIYEPWPVYPSYARARKFSKEIKTLNKKHDFIPSNVLKVG
ncbi:uncharacterized protein [Chelonus insularis]|uniref:uncharacterized protein isoform X2 n=1 Tax=Chelonus insularis TaxID=460826 RepID=UPI0015887B65|nr:uncharacterized protein LOC118072298 isoform X2 [Chelonus insularis]